MAIGRDCKRGAKIKKYWPLCDPQETNSINSKKNHLPIPGSNQTIAQYSNQRFRVDNPKKHAFIEPEESEYSEYDVNCNTDSSKCDELAGAGIVRVILGP